MITTVLTIEQAKLIEDALARLAVSNPSQNLVCAEAYRVIINARQEYQVKEMIKGNPETGSNWLTDTKEIA